MSERDDFDWTSEEKKAFDRLPREAPPAREVRDRIVRELEARGQLTSRAVRRRRAARFLVAAAAGLALFAAGWALGARTLPRRAGPDDGRPRFILFLYGETAADPRTEADRVAEYRDWARALAQTGSLVSGEKLADRSDFLGKGATPAPAPGGFFIVSARDESDAVAIARSHPHLKHGGSILVRPIEPTS